MIMSTTDERKFAFLGSKDPEISNKILDFFIKLGASNIQKLLCRSEVMYYFIDKTNKIDNSSVLPEGYIHQLQTYLNIMKKQEDKIPEYVECVEEQPQHNHYGELGKIYKVLDWNCSITDCLLVGTTSGSTAKERFKPSTKEAYEAQNIYLKAAEYTPQVGDYVVMEKAGGWGYSPDNNGCVAIVNRVGKTRVGREEVFSIWGEVINPNNNNSRGVKFRDIPQFGYNKEVIFRKALPHEIPGSNVKAEPQQQVTEWSKGTYAVGIKGNFHVYSNSPQPVIKGKVYIIEKDSIDNKLDLKDSCYWAYKENFKWFATKEEAVQFSNRLQFEASSTAAVSESPLEICRKMYKKGMLVRSAKEYGEYSGEFIIDVDPSEFTNTGDGVDYFNSKGWLYISGKFAEILEEPKENNPHVILEQNIRGSLERVLQYPITPENAFPVKAIKKQIKKNKFQEVHEIKIVEEKLLKKTKSKLFNI